MAGAILRRTRATPLTANASSMATNSAAVEAGLRTPLGTGSVAWIAARPMASSPAAATTTSAMAAISSSRRYAALLVAPAAGSTAPIVARR